MAECCAADQIEDITVVLKREEHQDFGFHILGGKDAPYLPYDNGIYVSKIVSDSVADRVGNLAPGDKILSLYILYFYANEFDLSNVDHEFAVSILRKCDQLELHVEKDAEERFLTASITAPSERFESSTSDSEVLDHTALSEEHDNDTAASMKNGSVMEKKFQCLGDESSSDRFYTKIVQRLTNLPARQFLFFGVIPVAAVVLFTILVRSRKHYR
ncbi:Synaptojanin-2-binding protein [Trichinella papuae]|uniref:Synaptojanin-2-binding protein n=1 Tax=Trichinella papuae TaxID=268474 RepID=A0A0V1N6C3_9BILA|nr:Synaptojanin-2-binding protein [Trichinella papuae]